jgi:dephospho-CoA kinase
VIVVWAPEWIQRKRALLRHGMTAEKLDGILSHQVSQTVKRRLADLVLPSSLGRAETRKRLLRWLRAHS